MPNLRFSNSPQINKCPKVTMGAWFKLPFCTAPLLAPAAVGWWWTSPQLYLCLLLHNLKTAGVAVFET